MAFTDTRLRYGDSTLTRTPDLVRWGPVAAGVIIGLGFFALLNSLWFAVAYGAAGGWVSGNLSWFVGGTAALSLLIAGCVAGALAGVRGMLAGLVNGTAAWGLLFIISVTAVLPGALNLTGAGIPQGGPLGPDGQGLTAASAMWTAFWSLLVGLALAAGGGILGGRMRRSVVVDEEHPPPVQQPVPDQERVDHGAERTEALERGEVHSVPHR
jgi:hypothetical protein